MWIYILLTVLCGSLLSLVVYLATKNGSRAAQLEAIKAELRKISAEQEKVNAINKTIASLDANDARRMLHDVANEQSKRMQ